MNEAADKVADKLAMAAAMMAKAIEDDPQRLNEEWVKESISVFAESTLIDCGSEMVFSAILDVHGLSDVEDMELSEKAMLGWLRYAIKRPLSGYLAEKKAR